MSLLTCRKIAVLKFTVFALHEEKPKGVGAHFTSSEKASSVPGRMHTAVVESSGAANPRVPVLKLTVLSLSPTSAGRDLTWWRLKSHMAEELPDVAKPHPFLLPEPAQSSNRARRWGRCAARGARSSGVWATAARSSQEYSSLQSTVYLSQFPLRIVLLHAQRVCRLGNRRGIRKIPIMAWHCCLA